MVGKKLGIEQFSMAGTMQTNLGKQSSWTVKNAWWWLVMPSNRKRTNKKLNINIGWLKQQNYIEYISLMLHCCSKLIFALHI